MPRKKVPDEFEDMTKAQLLDTLAACAKKRERLAEEGRANTKFENRLRKRLTALELETHRSLFAQQPAAPGD